jgi:4-hydroxythreonine-4-phosphate dehydrogenase
MNPIAISLGDPAGIGPELIAASWILRGMARLEPFVAVGSRRVLDEAARHRGLDVPVRPVGSLAEAVATFDSALPVLDLGDADYTPASRPTRAPCSRSMRSTPPRSLPWRGNLRAGDRTGLQEPPGQRGLQPSRTDRIRRPGQWRRARRRGDDAGRPSLKVVPMTVHVPLHAVPGLITPD